VVTTTELKELCLSAPSSLTNPTKPSMSDTLKVAKDAEVVQIDNEELAKTVQIGVGLSPK
jgi:hypothetical protein